MRTYCFWLYIIARAYKMLKQRGVYSATLRNANVKEEENGSENLTEFRSVHFIQFAVQSATKVASHLNTITK